MNKLTLALGATLALLSVTVQANTTVDTPQDLAALRNPDYRFLPISADQAPLPDALKEGASAIYRASQFDVYTLDDLIRYGIVGASHDLRLGFADTYYGYRFDIPGYSIERHIIKGYNPETDAQRPYANRYSSDIRYRLWTGYYDMRRESQPHCDQQGTIAISQENVYLIDPSVDMSAEIGTDTQKGLDPSRFDCEIEALKLSYGLMNFLTVDRPETIRVVPLNHDTPINHNKENTPWESQDVPQAAQF